jgi:hypothetical protein
VVARTTGVQKTKCPFYFAKKKMSINKKKIYNNNNNNNIEALGINNFGVKNNK